MGPADTYHGALEAVLAFFELFQSLLLRLHAREHRADLVGADISQDSAQLLRSRRSFGHVQVKLWAVGIRLARVVAGLILGGVLSCVGRDLLEEVDYPHRGGGVRLVEDGDDVLGLVLQCAHMEQRMSAIGSGTTTEGDHRYTGTHEAKHFGGWTRGPMDWLDLGEASRERRERQCELDLNDVVIFLPFRYSLLGL
jgi:hypothetical protein